MAHYVGLDVSVRHTSICIVDEVGKLVREARVASELVQTGGFSAAASDRRVKPDAERAVAAIERRIKEAHPDVARVFVEAQAREVAGA